MKLIVLGAEPLIYIVPKWPPCIYWQTPLS